MTTLAIPLDPETAERLAALAAEEGRTPEALAAEAVADLVNFAFDGPPSLKLSDEELRASIEKQRREIAAGTAKLYSHEEVMAGARAILAKAQDAKP